MIPPMNELIEDYGFSTTEPCVECLAKKRINPLVMIRASEAEGDFFMVCPWCDVEVDKKAH